MTVLSETDALRVTPTGASTALLRGAMALLVAATWLSGAIFGAYILAFFGGTALGGVAERWNESLAGLHDAGRPFATLVIGSHFLTGGVLLLLGPIQLIGGVRRAAPALHRWLGRIYVLCAFMAGLGGLGFILSRGTIGGPVMNLGFGIYGLLMMLCAALTYTHARAGRQGLHRAWAIRLFALTVGSWLFRMDYGFWFTIAGRIGHDSQFTGWFDRVMVFFFYVPNLIVAELAIRARRAGPEGALAATATTALTIATAFVLLATWSFTADYWGPGIVSGLTGAPL